MNNYSKVFCLILLALLLPYSPAIAKDKTTPTLFNPAPKSDNGNDIMKSMSWNSPKSDKDAKTKEEEEEEEAISDKDKEKSKTSDNNDEKEELTPEQKLWEKYKALAAGGKSKSNKNDKVKNSDDNLSEAKNENSDEKFSPEEKENKEKAAGLTAIIKNYRDAQKDRGKMNSRSFGNID